MLGSSAAAKYFRTFPSCGVIAVALIMYARRSAKYTKAGQISL